MLIYIHISNYRKDDFYMAYDGLTNYFIANELKSHLIDGKIDKIFQPNQNEILLGI